MLIARMPQWTLNFDDRTLRIHVEGVPKYWCNLGIAPYSMEPFHRLPITGVAGGARKPLSWRKS